MAPSSIKARSSSPPVSGDPTVLIVGTTFIGVGLLLLFAGIIYWRVLQGRRAAMRENDAEKPINRFQTTRAPTYGFSRNRITPSVIFPIPANVAPTSEFGVDYKFPPGLVSDAGPYSRNISQGKDDIAEMRPANNQMPTPLDSQLAASAIGRSQSIITTPSVYSVTVSIGHAGNGLTARSSHMSTPPSPLNPSAHRESPSMDSTRNRSSFYSTQSGAEGGTIRGTQSPAHFGFPRSPRPHSPAMSITSTRSALIFAQNAHSAMNKRALQAFTPLLPDELPVCVDDTLSLLQTFDDGWCVCVLEEPHNGHTQAFDPGREIRMGCVPLWVFERGSKRGAQPLRKMRSTSLAITVELTPQAPSAGGLDAPNRPAWEREPVISWSNF
ncbi:hypothetical protein BS47DRAFT_1385454 [Hydnum rufescens UP504]|uniref:SH3 domain-containing protein n=1 Tax=Hydnum rufescens UP504 TaxID=1448309 RepID=A0A9P6AK01_9AGAM|nr:hypothetical protein BS47DRAFT_1385454 [Hydnum rufescens UP504]